MLAVSDNICPHYPEHLVENDAKSVNYILCTWFHNKTIPVKHAALLLFGRFSSRFRCLIQAHGDRLECLWWLYFSHSCDVVSLLPVR